MSLLPDRAIVLKGGCFCSAVRYVVQIPALEDRPLAPGALPAVLPKHQTDSPVQSDTDSVKRVTKDTRFPLIELDHCHSCRRACGSILQSWFICTEDWVHFELELQKDGTSKSFPTLQVVNPPKDVQEATFIRHYSGTAESERTFCGRCGTPLTFFFSGDRGQAWTLPPIFDIALGTLDQESFEAEGVQPDRQGWWSDGTAWVQHLLRNGDGGLIRHQTGRVSMVVDEDKSLVGL